MLYMHYYSFTQTLCVKLSSSCIQIKGYSKNIKLGLTVPCYDDDEADVVLEMKRANPS